MRIALYAAATAAVATIFSPASVTGALAAAASALCEAVPFLLAGTLLQALLRDDRVVAYAGCGCARGPSARSIPAAVATAMIFGVWIALARVLAASVVAAVAGRRIGPHPCAAQRTPLLADLHALTAAALLAGCAAQLSTHVSVATMSRPAAALAGLALGFVAAPCALGAVTIAAALHARAPIAAATFLCVTGIFDLRALFGRRERPTGGDATAYVMLSAALAVVAARHGDALVRPGIAPLLAFCAGITAICAVRYRRRRDGGARFAPAIMLAGVMVAAPPPAYTMTETTLTDLFPGERLDFTGRLARNGDSAALVRYAITCCRADATPVAVRLSVVAPNVRAGEWIRASGSIENAGNDFRLRVARLVAVGPPTDPFIYR